MTSDLFMSAMLDALPDLRRTALALTRNPDLASDLVQDTVERGMRYREKFAVGTNMRAWLCFIARNLFYSQARRAWRSTGLSDELARSLVCRGNAHHRLELGEALHALGYLPHEQRDALLAIAEGATYEDAAQEFGCEVGTIKSRVSRARDSLNVYFSGSR